MSAIKLKSKVKTIDLENDSGEIIGKISFNPEDIGAYNELLAIGEIITKISEKYDSTKVQNDIPEGKFESVEQYKVAQNTFSQIGEFTNFVVKQVDLISEKLDKIFGKNTSELIFQGGHDLEQLSDFIEAVIPYFKNAKNKRVNKYLDRTEGDVM